MDLAIALMVGLIVGSALTWLVHREELQYLRGELKVAHAQIAHAVIEDRAVIPPRLEPVPPPDPLPSELRPCVEQWDSPESQAIEEHKIRGYLAEGYGIPAILRLYGMRPEGA